MFEPPLPDDEMPCPNCGEVIKKKAILCRFCQHGLSTEHFRRCNDCGEMVRIESKHCRYCKSLLESRPAIRRPVSAADARSALNSYGSGVRTQVFEVIVRQAMAGAPWRQICAGPMQVNNIDPEEIEQEVNRRRGLLPQTPPKADQLEPIISLIVDYARHNRRWKRLCFPILLALSISDSIIDQKLDNHSNEELSKEGLSKLVMLLVSEIAATHRGWHSFCLPLMEHHNITIEDIEQIRSKDDQPRPPFSSRISDQEIDSIFQRMGIPPEKKPSKQPKQPENEAQSEPAHQEIYPLVLKDVCAGGDPSEVLVNSAKRLMNMLEAHRVVVWRLGTTLKVLTECSTVGKNVYTGVTLPESESTAVMLELVAAQAKNLDVITWKQPFADIPLLKSNSNLYSLISFTEGTHVLLVPLISGGSTRGLAMVHLSSRITSGQVSDLKRTCDLMALCFEKIEMEYTAEREEQLLKLFKFIATRFKTKTTFPELRSVCESLGTYLGFVECSLYSVETTNEVAELVSIDGKDIIAIDEKTNDPIVTSLLESKPKLLPPFGTKLFGFDTALVLPLIKRSQKIGVVIFWKLADAAEVRPKELEIAATFSEFLAALVETTDEDS